MKNIFLQKLVITNFKGIKSLDIPFSQESFIYGANGTGKTTISDAFMWLLFGKNTEERKDFSIKPMNSDGSPAQKIENEVTGFFIVDSKSEVLKRIQREKWVKSRGELEATFQGNETLFFWNDVPLQAGEYQKRVSELIAENLFKLITSPFSFPGLNWTEKRSIITAIAGEVNDGDIASSREDFRELLRIMEGKSFDDFKKELAAKRKKLKDEIQLIPARIDEVEKGKPQTPDVDLIQIDINNCDSEISKLNDRIKDISKEAESFNQEKAKRNQRIGEINQFLFNVVEQEKAKIRTQFSDQAEQKQLLESEIKNIQRQIDQDNSRLKQLHEKVQSIDKEIISLRAEWNTENVKTLSFSNDQFVCPTCKRSYDVEDIEVKQAEMTENFNRSKSEKLSSIQAKGVAKSKEREAIIAECKELEESVSMQTEIVAEKNKELHLLPVGPSDYDINVQAGKAALENAEYKAMSDELDRLNEVNNLPFAPNTNTSAIEFERKQWEAKRDELKLKLKDTEVIDRANARITELQSQHKTFAQELAELEKAQFTMESFEKEKANLTESKVNVLFSKLKFRMFKQNINGSIEPTCEVLINGVPFTDANTASQINAGIEIINVLCKHYNVSAPIFIDNRESCTEIIPTESQIINLVVSPEHKVLTIK